MATITTPSHPLSFHLTTGPTLYHTTILPLLAHARTEILFATCFWSDPSPPLTALSTTLRHLSHTALTHPHHPRTRVQLCFSSRSLRQKLFHTSRARGHHEYAPSTWAGTLGLPQPEELRGLEMRVVSRFVRPWSVMHSKFVVVDRRRAVMPSCNLSGERWLEGAVVVEGEEVVAELVRVWKGWWDVDGSTGVDGGGRGSTKDRDWGDGDDDYGDRGGGGGVRTDVKGRERTVSLANLTPPTILLPSPHHASLRLSLPLPFLPAPPPPPTPLNSFLLHIFANASRSIQILTPNLTSPPVLDALLAALARGIDVSIVTNRRMMLLEQLVTAGTVTEFCLWKLARAYKKLQRTAARARSMAGRESVDGVAAVAAEEEEGRVVAAIGRLQMGYFRPDRSARDNDDGEGPVKKSHIKCTVVDEDAIVLGSGNMDRASWYTSQELGIAFGGRDVVARIWGVVAAELEGQVDDYYGRKG